MCHNVTVGTVMRYHSIVLRRYSPVHATGIMPEDACSKDKTGPIIVKQGCDRPNDIKSERPNVWLYSKAVTGPMIVLCRYGPITVPIAVLHKYGPVRATNIMNKGMCSKTVTGRIT